MERLKLDLKQLNKALKSLNNSFDVLRKVEKMNDVEIVFSAEDAIIQRFEYSYEAFWKFLKRYLVIMHHMENIHSSRNVFYGSVEVKLCTSDEGDIFTAMAADRNETSHTYSVERSRIILADIPRYYTAMTIVVERLNREFA